MSKPRLMILADPLEERWPSMDLVAEMLERQLRERHVDDVEVALFRTPIRRVARRLGAGRTSLNADRLLCRFAEYPLRAFARRTRSDLFHIADHSYAQLVHALPAGRTGVACHDLDAFGSLLALPSAPPRGLFFRAMMRPILKGLERAALVFTGSHTVTAALTEHVQIDPRRVVYAPYGVAEEFRADGPATPESTQILAALGGHPYVLHVGAALPRKRLDVLLHTFAELRAHIPGLRLLQRGATFDASLLEIIDRRDLRRSIVSLPHLHRAALAELYRRAALVLVPSDAEGFGLPVIEAMACGAPVLCSDIPVLREVGAAAASYARPGDLHDWAERARALLARPETQPPRADRLERASHYTWEKQASTILSAYLHLEDGC